MCPYIQTQKEEELMYDIWCFSVEKEEKQIAEKIISTGSSLDPSSFKLVNNELS